MGAGLPSWADLVRSLADKVEACPPDSSFLDIAQYYENQEGRGSLVRFLQQALGECDTKPTGVHKLLVGLPVQRIFTTNFDKLLETACTESRIPCRKILNAKHLSLLDNSRKLLIKLHGEIDLPESIVITAYDYERVTGSTT
jgi:hypothetical protein